MAEEDGPLKLIERTRLRHLADVLVADEGLEKALGEMIVRLLDEVQDLLDEKAAREIGK